MKASIASAPAKTWNKKNLPASVEQFEESSGPSKTLIKSLPSALGLARRRPGIFIVAALGILGLAWFLSNRD